MRFLVAQEFYRLMQRELPEGVYPDGAPDAFYSTADIYAFAQLLEDAEENLGEIFDNYFPQTAISRLDAWEVKMFGSTLGGALTTEERRAKIVAKVRALPSLSLWQMLTTVLQFVPQGTFVQVVPRCASEFSGWRLGSSRLGWEARLGYIINNPLSGVEETTCTEIKGVGLGWRLGVMTLGSETKLSSSFTWQELSKVQRRAYAYDVRVFNHALTSQEKLSIATELKKVEPARSGHYIFDNLDLNQFGLVVEVLDADQFSGVNCIASDPLQNTGYKGLERIT